MVAEAGAAGEIPQTSPTREPLAAVPYLVRVLVEGGHVLAFKLEAVAVLGGHMPLEAAVLLVQVEQGAMAPVGIMVVVMEVGPVRIIMRVEMVVNRAEAEAVGAGIVPGHTMGEMAVMAQSESLVGEELWVDTQ